MSVVGNFFPSVRGLPYAICTLLSLSSVCTSRSKTFIHKPFALSGPAERVFVQPGPGKWPAVKSGD